MKKNLGFGIELVELGGNSYEFILNENTTSEDVETAFLLLEEQHEVVHLVIGNEDGTEFMHLFHKKGSNKIDKKVNTNNKFDFVENKVEWEEKENVELPKKLSNRQLKKLRGKEKAEARAAMKK